MLYSTKLSPPQLNALVMMNAGEHISGKQSRAPGWRLGITPIDGTTVQALKRRGLIRLIETWDGDIAVKLTEDGRTAARTGHAPKRYAYKARTRIDGKKQPYRWKRICAAKTRQGTACIAMALENGRCKNHGGMSTGPRTPEGRQRIAEARREYMNRILAGGYRRPVTDTAEPTIHNRRRGAASPQRSV